VSFTIKYVDDFDRCSPEHEGDEPCVVCETHDNIAWRGFSTEEENNVACISCVAAGLPDWIQQGRGGQAGELEGQLRGLHPDWSEEEIAADMKAKQHELARRTPPILSWQEWFWPACCGDYCRFLQHCGQRDLDSIARRRGKGTGLELLREGLIDPHLQPPEAVWSFLPADSLSPSSNHGTQAYAFECLTCKRILVEWDAC
jgi:uncharacterized protein CbrC (UPF0167 family)